MLAATVAQATPLLEGPAGTVDPDDVLAAIQAVPAASRQTMLGRSEAVRRQAESVYLRRALAAEAERDGLDRDPAVAAALVLARERVLADARIAAVERAALPSDADVSRRARELYLSSPERYRTPAQARASHILVARSADGRAREQAESLLARVRAGESFEALAREYSADGATAASGGDLGWFASGQMVKPFEEAVAALNSSGDLGPIVETQFGFHVVRLDARRAAGVRPFEEVRDSIEAEVRQSVRREAGQAKIAAVMKDVKADQAAIEAFARQQQRP
jgi:peptidyl-prolyl cis-trans isomerase C